MLQSTAAHLIIYTGQVEAWYPTHLLVNLLTPTDYGMNHKFNIQQLCILPTLYLYVLIYLRKNSDLCHLHHELIGFITEMKNIYSAVRTGSLNKAVCASSLKGWLQTYVLKYDANIENTPFNLLEPRTFPWNVDSFVTLIKISFFKLTIRQPLKPKYSWFFYSTSAHYCVCRCFYQ
jgi:hypothetical protein